MRMRPDMKCAYPNMAEAMATKGVTWNDVQTLICVGSMAMVRRRKGETPFSDLEQRVIAEYLDADRTKLFSKEV